MPELYFGIFARHRTIR